MQTTDNTEPCMGGLSKSEPCTNRIPIGTTPRLCGTCLAIAHLFASAMRVPSLS
jgi:hypothetical protein